MEACFRETTKYIKIYIPTGKTGKENPNSGWECKKIIINKEDETVYTSQTFIRKDEFHLFNSKISKENLGDKFYPIYAKALLLFGNKI